MDLAIGFINRCIIACLGWFANLMSSSNMTQTWLSWIFVMLVGRFFLFPILGAGLRDQGSDTVKAIKNRNKGDKKNG